MTIDVYLMRMSPPCRAVLMTAKHLDIDLNVINIDLSEGEQLKPEYIKLNPSHTVPTINDDGFVLWESRAIMQYLCNKYAPDSSLYPKDPKKRAVVDRMLYFDFSIMGAQREALFMKLLTGMEPAQDKVDAYRNILKLLDQLIGENEYLTGSELTIADLSIKSSTSLLDHVQFDVSDYPNFNRWQNKMKELPYYEEINHIDPEVIQAYVAKMKAKFTQKASE